MASDDIHRNTSNDNVPVSPIHFSHQPQYFSRLKPAIHQCVEVANDASTQCQIDILGMEHIGEFDGNLFGNFCNLAAVICPFSSPMRLALCSYVIEASLILDSISAEFSKIEATQNLNNGIRYPGHFSSSPVAALILLNAWKERFQRVYPKMMTLVLQEDPVLGRKVMNQWEVWRDGERKVAFKSHEFMNLEQYLSVRLEDVGAGMLEALLRFSHCIHLNEDEETVSGQALQPLWCAITLTNDYFSWEKEYANEPHHLMNAVALHMRWYTLSAEDAKSAVKDKIIELEDRYLELKEEYLRTTCGLESSGNLMRWFDTAEVMVAGNMLFHMSSPRYHASLKSEYMDYFTARHKAGFQFFEDCTQSKNIISNI